MGWRIYRIQGIQYGVWNEATKSFGKSNPKYVILLSINPFSIINAGERSVPSDSPFTSFGGASDETQPWNIMEFPSVEPGQQPAKLANEEPAAEPDAAVAEPEASAATARELPQQDFSDSDEASRFKSLSFRWVDL